MGFRQLAEPQGFDVVIEPVDIQIQRNQPYDVYMLEHDYVGSFVIGFSLADPWLKDFENSCTPTVLYDNYITGNPSTAYVGIDNDEGMELAVSHLVRQGHRKLHISAILLVLRLSRSDTLLSSVLCANTD